MGPVEGSEFVELDSADGRHDMRVDEPAVGSQRRGSRPIATLDLQPFTEAGVRVAVPGTTRLMSPRAVCTATRRGAALNCVSVSPLSEVASTVAERGPVSVRSPEVDCTRSRPLIPVAVMSPPAETSRRSPRTVQQRPIR